jgi:thiol-disulfide isomerase/thioredoxin
MPVIASLLAVVGVVAVANLAFTMAVVRRLREHEERLSGLAGTGAMAPATLEIGDRPDAFTTVDAEDGPLDEGFLSDADGALVGFFAPWCEPCKEWLPRFVEAAAADPGTPALAVLLSDEGWEEMAERLSPVARVVAERNDGVVHTAFRSRNYPTLYRLDASGAVARNENAEVVQASTRA